MLLVGEGAFQNLIYLIDTFANSINSVIDSLHVPKVVVEGFHLSSSSSSTYSIANPRPFKCANLSWPDLHLWSLARDSSIETFALIPAIFYEISNPAALGPLKVCQEFNNMLNNSSNCCRCSFGKKRESEMWLSILHSHPASSTNDISSSIISFWWKNLHCHHS